MEGKSEYVIQRIFLESADLKKLTAFSLSRLFLPLEVMCCVYNKPGM